MNLKLPVFSVLALLSACATEYNPQEVEAVRDYIAAAELNEVEKIRINNQMNFAYVNDFFVTIPTRRGDYLVEFSRQCRDLRRTDFTPEMVDLRDNQNIIRSRFDTIRGCRIGTIYEITDMQRRELHDLGDAPGDEVFLPDEKKENTE